MREEAKEAADVKPDEEGEGRDMDDFSSAFLNVIRATTLLPGMESWQNNERSCCRSAGRRFSMEPPKRKSTQPTGLFVNSKNSDKK